MKKFPVVLSFIYLFSVSLYAHFGVILPSTDIAGKGVKAVSFDIMFMHPMEQNYMNMEKPIEFGAVTAGKKENLTELLKENDKKGNKAWRAVYKIKRPGDYIFYVVPKPYWEPTEDKFIVHYTKTVVNGYGLEDNWDKEIGLKTEIIPLTRPYGLWQGNVFRGIVKAYGKVVPYAKIEVEYFNKGSKIKIPQESMTTQIIKADKNGVFCYGMPFAGWWGFAALTEAKEKIEKNGKKKDVELGAVLWIKAYKNI